MSMRVAPNLPTPVLPPDLAAAWVIHEGHRWHAIHEACSVAVGWAAKELHSGAWITNLRAHRCWERGV